MSRFNGRKMLGLQKMGAVVSKATGLTKLEANKAVRALFDLLALSLLKREVVVIKDFGAMSVKKRTGRRCHDLQTKTVRQLPDMDYAHFKPTQRFNDMLEPELADKRTGKARKTDRTAFMKRLMELEEMIIAEGLQDVNR